MEKKKGYSQVTYTRRSKEPPKTSIWTRVLQKLTSSDEQHPVKKGIEEAMDEQKKYGKKQNRSY